MALTDSYGNYQKEVDQAARDARRAARRFQKDCNKMMNNVQPKMKEIIRAITDMSKVTAPQRTVVEVFAWSAALVLVSSVGSFLGAYVVGPVIGVGCSKFTACILAYFVIPVALHASIRHKEKNFESDHNIRKMMIWMSLVHGIFVGYTIDHRYLSAQPVAFLTPVAVSVGYSTRGNVYPNILNALFALFKGMTFYLFGTYEE
ncbi:unnamed protein product [Nippostrongylus brasiliensis]|uniref:Golgi apparatus membrane protein TVP38 n=1 Tax=Nippostrongylus brasiliensis TaxID=27835 RepID=A0A0N4YP84_NIPBR|nr:unnamed protein product [Nippostrongylus brasiliensis]